MFLNIFRLELVDCCIYIFIYILLQKNDEETSEINSAAEKAKKKADEAKEKLLKMQECAKKQVFIHFYSVKKD